MKLEERLDRAFAWALGAVSVVGALAIAWAASPGAFLTDDVTDLVQAREMGLTPAYLIEPITGTHVLPARRLLSWVVAEAGPDWSVAALLMALSMAACVAFAGLAAREATGSAGIGLVTAGFVAGALVYLRAASWWSSGVQEIPASACMFAGTWAALRRESSKAGRKRWLAFSAALFALGLMFFERYLTALLPTALLLVVGRPISPSLRWAQLRSRLSESAPVLGAMVLVAGACVAVTLAASAGVIGNGGVFPQAPQVLADWPTFMRHWWTDGFAGTVLNSSSRGRDLVIPALVVVVGLLALTARGSRPALLWLGIGLCVTANGIAIGTARGLDFGLVFAAADPRYNTLNLYALAILLPAAWATSRRPRSLQGTMGALLPAVALVAWWWAGVSSDEHWRRQAATVADYAHNLERSTAALEAGGRPFTLIDFTAPPSLVFGVYPPYNRISRLAWIYTGRDLPFDRLTGRAYAIGSDGTARPIGLGSMTVLHDGGGDCPGGRGAAASIASLALAPEPEGRPRMPRLLTVALAGPSSSGELVVRPSPGYERRRDLNGHPGGLRVSIGGSARSVSVILERAPGACIRSVSVQPIITGPDVAGGQSAGSRSRP